MPCRLHILALPGALCLWTAALVLPAVPAEGQPVAAQPSAVAPGDTTRLARVGSGRALALDPRGRLYVADAGRDAVVLVGETGRVLATIGGPGTRTGEFSDPADVDPTNGQSFFVADAGNGRLQRFSSELQYLEALPVGRSFDEGASLRAFDDGRDGSQVRGDGRPVAVVSSEGDQVYAIDGRDGVVRKWDEQRRPERVIGDGVRPPGRLDEPVALALLQGALYVADRGAGAVLAYDRFGTFQRRLPLPRGLAVRGLATRRGRLWIVCRNRMFVWAPSTRQAESYESPLSAPLVDAAPHADGVYLLTATRLWNWTGL